MSHPFLHRVRRRLGRYYARALWPGSVARETERARLALAPLWKTQPAWNELEATSPYSPRALEQLGARLAPEATAALRQAADAAAGRQFAFLGGAVSYAGRDIDWHLDFKSGYRWDPAQHHTRLPLFPSHPGADIKIPWELSRCQHLPPLALQARLNHQPPLAAEFQSQVLEWIRANPVGAGVNWMCAMDVALRAVNWIAGLWLLLPLVRAAADERTFLETVALSLWQHARHIEQNLEWRGPRDPHRGNHFVSDLVGLLAIGAVLREAPAGARWFAFAHRLLQRELAHQVLPDGVIRERALGYQRLVTELFLFAQTVAERCGHPFGPDYEQGVRRLRHFIAAYTLSSGAFPAVGDDDDGRVLACGGGAARTHAYLIEEPRPDAPPDPDRFLLSGEVAAAGAPSFTPQAFPQGGFYVLKLGEAEMVVRAGALGPGGGHAHNDQLAFTLALYGVELLVDHGTGVYSADPALRNRFRSTAHHNTLRVAQTEQSPLRADRAALFSLPDFTRARVVDFQTSAAEVRWVAEHEGYSRLSPPAVHRRTLHLRRGELVVQDELLGGSAGFPLEWHFHLHPDVYLEPGLPVGLQRDALALQFHPPPDALAEPVDCLHSERYGVTRPARCLRCVARPASTLPTAGWAFRFLW